MRHLPDDRGRVDTAAPFYDLVLLVDRLEWDRQMAERAAAKVVSSPVPLPWITGDETP